MRSLVVAALGTILLAQGQRIPAKDGDVVVINSGAQVRVVRRGAAMVRAIFNPAQHWLLILADYDAPNGASDGGVDTTFTFQELGADWPMGERWEGKAVLEEYSVAGDMGPWGLGVVLPGGLVQLFDVRGDKLFRDASAVSVIGVRGGGRGGGGSQSFDAAERQQVASIMRSLEMNARSSRRRRVRASPPRSACRSKPFRRHRARRRPGQATRPSAWAGTSGRRRRSRMLPQSSPTPRASQASAAS